MTGIDNRPRPRYPFAFIQADALEVAGLTGGFRRLAAVRRDPRLAAMPGLQQGHAAFHIGLPAADRPGWERLRTSGLPWVIENVPGSGLPAQDTLDGALGVELCGTMFRRPFRYHRLFETSFPISAPRGCDHSIRTLNPRYGSGPGRDTEAAWREAIGVPWASQQGGREAIPVAYAEYVGTWLLETLELEESA